MLFLYFLPYFISLGSIGDSLIIPDWAASLAAVSFGLSFITYLFVPKKYLFAASFCSYLLLAALTAALVFTTGNASSSFIALWILVSVFASIFGYWGILPLFGAIMADIIYVIYDSAVFPAGEVVTLGVVGITPIITGYIMFHVRHKKHGVEATVLQDLTTELTQVSNKSDVVIKAIDDGVIALDGKGNIELMNPAAQRILGWGKGDALGLNYKSVLVLADKDNQKTTDANDPILSALSTNKDVHTKDFSITTDSGKKRLLSLVVSPIGQVGEGIIVVFSDITREAQEEREQAEFISTASHEMRTPVASIEGYLGLALNPNTAQIDAKARDFITKAHQSAQHLGRLFQDLLDVSKAEDGRLSNHPQVVDVVEYLADVVEGMRPRAEEKHLRLLYKPIPDQSSSEDTLSNRSISPVFYTNVDNDHLREIVANLIENAIKYTQEGDVIVDVGGDEEHVVISVTDSGIGIAPEDIPHLFQKFYRVDNSATREIGGTGLGLYLCRRLAEIMGGRIWVESEFGKGSTFNFELPRTEREEAMRLIDAMNSTLSQSIQSSGRERLPEEPVLGAPKPAQQPAASLPSQSPLSAAPSLPPTAPLASTPQPVPAEPVPAPAQAPPTLAVIEQNPTAYAQQFAADRAPSIKIPIRNTNQPK